ncbi:MAG: hypothetical protein SOV71_07630 [Anaerovoracaceae bacterium]|nr:hypothetical protein [Bacillota bacterium]MDY2671400.1 hypothetical protein [Anaerovoracaceae bacterium]
MAILDNKGDAGKKAAQNVGEISKSIAQKIGEFTESSKISMNIRKKEKEIRTTKFNIGKLVYEQYKNGHEFDESIVELCKAIDTEYAEISKLETEKESVGIDDLGVEVVDADIPEDMDFAVTEDDDEILKEL